MARAAWPTRHHRPAAGAVEGAVLGARRDPRRSGGALLLRRPEAGRARHRARRAITRRSCAPSTRRSRATRSCSCAGSARARSSKKTTCATARPSCTGCWPTPTRSRCGSATARPSTCSRASSASGRASAACCARCSASSPRATTRPRALLFETYGVHFDPELRNEIVARVDRAQPAVLHRLRDADADAACTAPPGRSPTWRSPTACDFAAQMLGYSEERRRG